MNPSMLFRYSNGRLDVESIDSDNTVVINFWTTNGSTTGYISLDEEELKRLREWIDIQLGSIVQPTKKKS